MSEDRLETIFAMQKELNRKIGVDTDRIQADPEAQKTWLLNYARAMSQEVAELTDSVPWKWWAKYQKIDLDNAKVEIVDLLHFLVSAAQVAGLDAAGLHDLYTRKHRVNQDRQKDGYATKDEGDNRALFGK
ncbi:MAG: dUTP diphosphatase [Planctomycetes bacterium]|nr:dUTP diphosphatase [Planctomycetota bacterium]